MEQSNNKLSHDFANQIEVTSLLLRFLRNWYWFVLIAGLAYAGAVLFLRYEISIYSVSAKILIQEDKQTDVVGPATARMKNSFFSQRYFLANQMEVLQSQRLMESLIEELKLNVRYYTLGRVKTSEVYGFFPYKIDFIDSIEHFYNTSFLIHEIDPEKFQLIVNMNDTLTASYDKVLQVNNKSFSVKRNFATDTDFLVSVEDPAFLAGSALMRMRIVPVKQSEVLTVSLSDVLPQRAIDILNGLIRTYNKRVLQDKNASTIKTINFIDDRLSNISKELFEVEKKVELFKKRNNVPIAIKNSAQAFVDKVSTGDDAIVEIELEENLFDGILEVLLGSGDTYGFLPVVTASEGERIPLIDLYNDLVKERKRLLTSAKPENPTVMAISGQLEDQKTNILNWIRLKQQELKNKKRFLQRKSGPLSDKIAAIPQFEREFLQIMREQKIKETIFNFLLQRREETAMTLASEVSNTTIINYPSVAGIVSPNRNRIIIVFMFFGLAIPALLFSLIEYFDNKVYSEKDIEKYTNAPFLGSIILGDDEDKLVVKNDLRSITAETFRQLRSNLIFLSQSNGNKVILITSSMSAEGKTFISLNLAASIALSGKKVVIVGTDLRKPKLSTYLTGKNAVKGVTNYITNPDEKLEDLIQNVPGTDGLFFLDSGPIPPNPSELLLSERTDKMFDLLQEQYDHIIIDSAPIGLVADAFSFKDIVDCSIYVTKFAYTKKGQVSIIKDIYDGAKLPNLGVVLNGVKGGSGYGYNRYGYSYYGNNETWLEKLKKRFR